MLSAGGLTLGQNAVTLKTSLACVYLEVELICLSITWTNGQTDECHSYLIYQM